MMRKFPNFIKNEIYLILILAVAGALRFIHIGWGLPDLFEEGTPLRIAWNFWNWGKPGFNFNPEFFNYPALSFYIQFAAQAVQYGFGSLFGLYPTINDFGSSLESLVYTARGVDALFDIGIISVTYLIGRELFNKRTGLISALILAVNPLHIKFSHLIQVDTILTFFSALAILYIHKSYLDPRPKFFYLSGIFIGLAAASKYTGAFLILYFAASQMIGKPNMKEAAGSLVNSRFITSLGAAIVLFLALNPFIIITPNAFEKDFTFEQQHMALGHLGVSESESTLIYYFLSALPDNFGVIFYVVVLLSVIILIAGRQKKEILILLYPLLFLIVVSTWVMRSERYILPIFPVVALIGSAGIDKFLSAAWGRQNNGLLKSFSLPSWSRTVFLLVILLLVIYQPFISSIEYLRSLGLRDTRTVVKSWIRDNISKNSVIATGPFGVNLREGNFDIFDIPFLAFESERVAPFYDARWYEETDLLVTSSYDRDRYAQEPVKYKDILSYYDSLESKWELVYEISPDNSHTGPSFRIYKFPDSLQRDTFDANIFQRFSASPESSRISNFLRRLSQVMLKKGKSEKAAQLLREILSVEYQNVDLRNQLGDLLLKMGKDEEALRHLGVSLQLNPRQTLPYLLGSKALRKLQQFSPAEGALQRCLEYNPNYQPAYLELIDLYTAQKEDDKLLDVLKRYYATLPLKDGNRKDVQERIRGLQAR